MYKTNKIAIDKLDIMADDLKHFLLHVLIFPIYLFFLIFQCMKMNGWLLLPLKLRALFAQCGSIEKKIVHL